MRIEWKTPSDTSLETASACLKGRRFAAAVQALQSSSAAVARTPQWALLRGLLDTRLGRIDQACERLLPLTRCPEPLATEAALGLAEAYHYAQRLDEMRALVADGKPWTQTPRGALAVARAHGASDPGRALALLMQVVDGDADAAVRRMAGFDAVRLLDRGARYHEAHALAQRMHQTTTPPFPLAEFLATLQLQLRLLGKGARWCTPRCAPVHGAAFIVGLPRSGTTLVEQMLDSHPDIAAIGEHEGMGDLLRAMVAEGVWPYRMNHLPEDTAAGMQRQYIASARERAARSTPWTVDKSLLTWSCLPLLAAILPGAVCIRVARDPRDMAISTFLSYFDPLAFGWTASLDAIRQVVAAERALVPQALATLGIAHESLVYEELVAQPQTHMHRCMDRMGLAMDDRVLAPENNRRTAVTLSHAQVRRAINDTSIGRWQHYDFAFDAAQWDALATAHTAARPVA